MVDLSVRSCGDHIRIFEVRLTHSLYSQANAFLFSEAFLTDLLVKEKRWIAYFPFF